MPGRLIAERPVRRLSCCRPVKPPYPGGPAWAHASTCRSRRNRKLDRLELVALGVRTDPPAVLTPAECDRIQPTGETALRACFAHPAECRCFACGYVGAHADDEMEDATP